MKPVAGVPEFVGGSTWQSLQRGTGNIETDYLNGEIVMIAHRLGIEAPINERLAILARRAAATGAKPGDLSAEQLAAQLPLIDQSLDVVGERCLDEARSALNRRRLDQVARQLAPGRALSTHGDRAEPDGLHEFRDWRRVRKLEIGLSAGHGEPDCFAGQPDRYRGSGSDAHRRDRPRLVRPLGRLGAAGDLDQERA